MTQTRPGIPSGLICVALAIGSGSIASLGAQENPSEPIAEKGLPLVGTQWKLVDLDGVPAPHDGLQPSLGLRQGERLLGGSRGELVDASVDATD